MQLATVNNQTMDIKEYNGQRVLTFKDIDKAHDRPDGTARKRFNENRNRFIEGVDYFNVQKSEKRTLEFNIPNRGFILITESGYLMLAKSFTDDLAWTVQRQLVNCYFRYKEQNLSQPSQLTLREIEHERLKSVLKATGYSYYDKTFNGEPVISLKDVAYYTGISPETAKSALRKHGKYGKDYFKVDHAQMMDFKSENRNVPACYTHLMLVTKSGFILLAELYGLDKDVFGCFAEPAPALPEHKEVLLPTPIELDTRSCVIALGVIQKLIDNAESDLENGRSLYPDVAKENIKAFKRTLKWAAMPIT